MKSRQVSVALLGLGNVGQAFLRYITTADLQVRPLIAAVADRSGALYINDDTNLERLISAKESGQSLREFAPDIITEVRSFVTSLNRNGVSFLIESLPTNIGDGQPALDLIAEALSRGTNVVTVDKGPLVHGFNELKLAQERGNSSLGYSGTTGVDIPDLGADKVLEIKGVLNGTTNYILSEMQTSNASFNQALATAQASGIAEPDPSLDVDGWDTVIKTLILAKALMGANTTLSEVSRIGIGPETEALIAIGRESGRIVRLVGRARIWQGRVRVSVAPKLLEPDNPFYAISGTSKAALFRTERHGLVTATSRSGRDAISQTILNDIERIASLRD